MTSAAAINRDFVDLVASEMTTGVDRAVQRWMAEFDSVLNDPRLTTLGRLQGVRDIVTRYRELTSARMGTGSGQPASLPPSEAPLVSGRSDRL